MLTPIKRIRNRVAPPGAIPGGSTRGLTSGREGCPLAGSNPARPAKFPSPFSGRVRPGPIPLERMNLMEILNGNELEVINVDQHSIIDPIAEAEKRVDYINKVMKIALKVTKPQDWVDFGGKPYLSGPGAERLRPLFGITLSDMKHERINLEDEKGTYYVIIVTGTVHFRGDSIPVIGTCSSRDQFFAVRYENNEKYYLPASEVDITNILKAAYTNMLTNAVTRCIGIRNLTWEQLDELGFDRSKAAKVEFAQGGKPANPKFDELKDKLNEISKGDQAALSAILKKITSYDSYTSKSGKEISAFAGYTNLEEFKKKAKNLEQASAIALNSLEKLIKSGQINQFVKKEEKADEPGPGDIRTAEQLFNS